RRDDARGRPGDRAGAVVRRARRGRRRRRARGRLRERLRRAGLAVDAGPPAAARRVRGRGLPPGVAIGPAYLFAAGAWQVERDDLDPEAVGDEIERFETAVARSERELARVATVAQEKLGDD